MAPDEAVKRSDPFHDSEKNGAVECVLAREDKSSIKFGLLPRKGNRSKMTLNRNILYYLTDNFHSYSIYKMSAECLKYLFKVTDPSFSALFQLR